ncbi:MAG: hypothetical protein PHG64_09635 [Paludibacter sp.]|nr:hypothetical protein [Paludibacter sp.]
MNEENLSFDKIRQNVHYLTGRNDYFIPFKMHAKQLALFIKAKSLTDRVYRKNEHAENHCQVGNIKLMLDDIIKWSMLKNELCLRTNMESEMFDKVAVLVLTLAQLIECQVLASGRFRSICYKKRGYI